jgi:hypothetical protein
MANLIYSEMSTMFLGRLQSNVATDPDAPFTAAEILERLNDAYATLWELSGGGVTNVTGAATTWTPSPTTLTDGKLVGVLRDIKEVMHLGATTASNTAVMGDAGVFELDPVEKSQIVWLRSNSTIGAYAVPTMFSVTRVRASSDVAANVGRYDLDVWPGVAGYFFPMEYVRQFVPLAGAGTDVADVDDLESRDIPLLAALTACPLGGRAELAPSIAAEISQRTQQAMERKRKALISADQDA